jgi:hypothetical protein
MTTWIDQQTDKRKLASPRRQEVVKSAIMRAELMAIVGVQEGILVKRDITSEDPYDAMRLVAGPHPSVPYGFIYEEER